MPSSDIEPELPGLESKSHHGKSGTATPSPMQLAIKWFRHKVVGRAENTLKEALEEVLEENSPEMQSISEAEKNLLKNMIHFGELTVHDIMVPRTQILALPKQTSLAELKTHIISIGHTRIPVYAESLDQIEGFIHVKDLFPFVAGAKPFDIAMVMREILFVPPSMKIVDLLVRMRMSGCHIAIVIDEYGGTDGLVTMEDLFEELVGEIQDEHDEDHEELMVEWVGGNIVEVDARVPIIQLEETLNESFRKEGDEVDTVGGLVFSALGRVPIKGEVLHIHPNFKCEIIAADPRRIRRLRITKHA
ncbi:MAG: HlyC/CorC family transporter [Alphaproteobacteria bacterium]|nr:HlyC/CorC family transporter [Alphaproteobacteria bacterium]